MPEPLPIHPDDAAPSLSPEELRAITYIENDLGAVNSQDVHTSATDKAMLDGITQVTKDSEKSGEDLILAAREAIAEASTGTDESEILHQQELLNQTIDAEEPPEKRLLNLIHTRLAERVSIDRPENEIGTLFYLLMLIEAYTNVLYSSFMRSKG